MEFQQRLYDLRKKAGLSQEGLADLLGVTRQAVQKWEAGTSRPDMDNLAALARYFNVTLDYLVTGEEPPAPAAQTTIVNNYYQRWRYEYKSQRTLFGLPLVHIRLGDRGTGVACAELAVLAGAQRVECCLFGNGERTGNVDIVTLAMNMYTQGVDPELDFSDMNKIKEMFERTTKMPVGDRQPYAGKLVFTAFSGSHQDAINKGSQYMKESNSDFWEIPYLPIDPADVGREYEPIIRINSQSGKGGAAYIMEHNFGYDLPKTMHPEFGHIVQVETDKVGTEISPERINELFHQEYIEAKEPYKLLKHAFTETIDAEGHSHVAFQGTLQHTDTIFDVSGEGNGPIDAFFHAIQGERMDHYTFLDYKSHAITNGSDSQGVAYILLQDQRDGKKYWGVGLSHNINLAPLRAILSAINRSKRK